MILVYKILIFWKIWTSQKCISSKDEFNFYDSAWTSLHFNCNNLVDCWWYSQTINCLLFLISIITGSKTNVWNVVVQSHWETFSLWILKNYWFGYWSKKVSKSLCRATNLNVTNNIEHWLIQILPDALLEFLYLFRNKSVSFGLWNSIGWLELLCSATQGINFFLICCI